jgi:hypothetical protein
MLCRPNITVVGEIITSQMCRTLFFLSWNSPQDRVQCLWHTLVHHHQHHQCPCQKHWLVKVWQSHMSEASLYWLVLHKHLCCAWDTFTWEWAFYVLFMHMAYFLLCSILLQHFRLFWRLNINNADEWCSNLWKYVYIFILHTICLKPLNVWIKFMHSHIKLYF